MKEVTISVSSFLAPSANLKRDGHFKRLAASSIMSIVCDYPTIKSEHDHTVDNFEKFDDRLGQALTTGSFSVDIFPGMKHIPNGLGFLSLRLVLLSIY